MPTPAEQAHAEKAKTWAEMDAADAKGLTPAAEATPEAPAAETTTTADPALETQTAAATAAAVDADAGKVVDPYEGLSQTVRDEIAGLKTMFAQTQTQLRTANGHIGGLTSSIKELRDAAKNTRATGGDAPTAEQLRLAQGKPSSMAKLKEDYPEFGAAMDAALDEKLRTVQEQIAQAKPAVAPAGNLVTREELNAYQVESAHKGWQERVKTPEFTGWLQNQQREVQALAASESPQDAIRLLDLHSEARKTASATDKQAQRLDSAAAIPTGRASSSARVKPLDQMTKAEYWAYLDEQDRIKATAAV